MKFWGDGLVMGVCALFGVFVVCLWEFVACLLDLGWAWRGLGWVGMLMCVGLGARLLVLATIYLVYNKSRFLIVYLFPGANETPYEVRFVSAAYIGPASLSCSACLFVQLDQYCLCLVLVVHTFRSFF